MPSTLLLLATAHAGVLDTWGAGEIGAAGNAGAAADGPHAAWYNPAGLRAEQVDASAELAWGSAGFTLDDTELEAEGTSGALLGLQLNERGLGLPTANLGVVLMLPFAGPYTWHDPSPPVLDRAPEPNVPRYSSDLSRMEVVLGANTWIGEHFAVGLGADVSSSFVTLTFVEIDDFDAPEESRKGQDEVIKLTFHPTMGLLVALGDPESVHGRLGLVGRTSRKMDDSGLSSAEMLGATFVFRHHYVRYYAPPSLTLGGELVPLEPLSLRAEASYEAWSQAVGPYAEPLGDGWRDVVTVRTGARLALGRMRLLAGFGYDPGPAERIPAGTLHVDGSSYALTGGLGAVVARPAEGRSVVVHTGLTSQRFTPTRLRGDDGAHTFEGSLLGLRVGVSLSR